MMQRTSNATGIVYRRVCKPFLFQQAPDNVHARMIRLGTYLQGSRVFRRIVHGTWAYDNPSVLGQTLHGVTYRNPVGLSAGFDKNFELPPMMKAIGFGFMEGGSATYLPCAGNPRPWFYRLPKTKSIVVYAGLGNEGITAIARRVRSFAPETFHGFPLNVSIAKTNVPEVCDAAAAVADYLGGLSAVQQAHIGHMITLNISCPNTYGGEPFTTPERLHRLLSGVDSLRLRQPIYLKMPCSLPWKAFRPLLDVASGHAVAGVTISNLAKDRGQARLMDPLPDTVRGNLSGRPTWELSNALIRETYKYYGQRLTIIGVGGIYSAEDAYIKIRLGAHLVELVTGLMFEGPQLIGQINQGLVQLLQRDGYRRIRDAVGADVA